MANCCGPRQAPPPAHRPFHDAHELVHLTLNVACCGKQIRRRLAVNRTYRASLARGRGVYGAKSNVLAESTNSSTIDETRSLISEKRPKATSSNVFITSSPCVPGFPTTR